MLLQSILILLGAIFKSRNPEFNICLSLTRDFGFRSPIIGCDCLHRKDYMRESREDCVSLAPGRQVGLPGQWLGYVLWILDDLIPGYGEQSKPRTGRTHTRSNLVSVALLCKYAVLFTHQCVTTNSLFVFIAKSSVYCFGKQCLCFVECSCT